MLVSVVAGVGVISFFEILFVLIRFLQFHDSLFCVLLFVDYVVEVVHFFGALALDWFCIACADAKLEEEEVEDEEDAADDEHQMD